MSEDIGTTIEYKTRSAVDRCSKLAYLRMKVNRDQPAEPDERFGVVLERYVQEEIPKRFSTKHAYLSYINNRIRPKWGEFLLTPSKTVAEYLWRRNDGIDAGSTWKSSEAGDGALWTSAHRVSLLASTKEMAERVGFERKAHVAKN
jgi:hypothetical protein